MRKIINFLPLLALTLLFAGCETTKITNLTPAKMERNSTGLYSVEAAWQTREHTIRPETIKPEVVVGLETYPMRPVPVVRNRWETLVPVPADKNSIYYRFKFDYEYNAIPVRRQNSKTSPEYKLEIVDKK